MSIITVMPSSELCSKETQENVSASAATEQSTSRFFLDVQQLAKAQKKAKTK
jgi:hypothetical protein